MAQPVLYDIFTNCIAGMNSGTDPSLIAPNQCFASRDFTFRDGFAKTRPPVANVVLTFDTPAVAAVWNTTGRFQGSAFYLAEFGQSGFNHCCNSSSRKCRHGEIGCGGGKGVYACTSVCPVGSRWPLRTNYLLR